MQVTVFEKPTCTTCRKTAKLLQEQGIEFERVNYFVDPLDEATIKRLLKKSGLGPRDIMRTKEPTYRELGLRDSEHTDGELIGLLVEHPDLVQRPIVERGDKAVLARPPEKVLELFE